MLTLGTIIGDYRQEEGGLRAVVRQGVSMIAV